ncbi:MAG: NTP transferase domain-containing protein [Candidatus Heimdallarchaeota archaeon]|nr:NTP transferase domain-containing protein [Candidatus Heimdallarchaeota archaeon]
MCEKSMIVIILAAGKGKRMQPLTDTRLKGSLPILNQPLLIRLADMIYSSGILDKLVMVISPWQKEAMEELFSQTEYSSKVHFAIQDPPQGTGDALAQAEPFMDDFQQCLVLNGDILVNLEEVLPSLITHHNKIQAACTILVFPGKNKRYGQLQITSDGRVLAVKEKITGEISDEIGYINAGVYLFERDIFHILKNTPLSSRGEYEITDAISLLGKTRTIGAVKTHAWMSLENPLDLFQAQIFSPPNHHLLCMQFHSGGEIGFKASEGIFFEEGPELKFSDVIIRGPVLLGKETLLEPGTIIGPHTFLGNNCEIGSKTVLSNSLLMDSCRIGANCKISNLISAEELLIGENVFILPEKTDDTNYHSLEHFAIFGGKSIITANTKINQGCNISAHSLITNESKIPTKQ